MIACWRGGRDRQGRGGRRGGRGDWDRHLGLMSRVWAWRWKLMSRLRQREEQRKAHRGLWVSCVSVERSWRANDVGRLVATNLKVPLHSISSKMTGHESGVFPALCINCNIIYPCLVKLLRFKFGLLKIESEHTCD